MPNEDQQRHSDPDLKFQDEMTGGKGILLSNEIDRLCQAGLLIVKKFYKPENLRPASYTLTIGRKYVNSEGSPETMDESAPFFYMEPNSIVFVSTAEELNLPFYIVARFNIRVEWVYNGILLGTGPQVDPGFQGNLSCPLFNLTNRRIKINLGEPFATIDFERTTDFCPDLTPDQLQELKRCTTENRLEFSPNGTKYLLFRQKPFKPLEKLPNHPVVSSLVELSDEVKKWRAIGIGIAVSFLALTLTLLGLQYNLLKDSLTNAKDIVGIKEQQNSLQQDLKEIKNSKNSSDKKEPLQPHAQPTGTTRKMH